MTQQKRVVVTGSAGRLGRAATNALVERGHHVIGFDRNPTPEASEEIIASTADSVAIYDAVQGIDCVIHLAATPDDATFPRAEPPNDGDNFLSELLPNNIVALYHLMEAVRKASVPKLVLASSGQVVWVQTFDGPWPVRAEAPHKPRYWYAATKAFLEAIGFSYAQYHNIAVLAVRLGWCPRPGQEREIAESDRAQDVYLSPGDAGRFFVQAVESDFFGYHVVYATSRPKHLARLDLSDAKRLLNFEPVDMWPTGVNLDNFNS